MTVTVETLSAIMRICKYLFHADGSVTREELQPVHEFLTSFGEMNEQVYEAILRGADEVDDDRALQLVDGLDETAKQELANLFADIVVADGEIDENEQKLYLYVQEACYLPDPIVSESPDGEQESAASDSDDDDEIVPSFIVIRFDGMTSIWQSIKEDWNALEGELAGLIGGKRVEIIRFTPPLNALSEQLNLNLRHLVFMIPRGFNGTAGDNMPASILYGGGYPIFGDIIIALETDDDYEIEGFATRSLLGEALDAVNAAVNGLLRTA